MLKPLIVLIGISTSIQLCAQYNLSYKYALDVCDEAFEQQKRENPKLASILSPTADCLEGYKLPKIEAATIEGKLISNHYFKDRVSIIYFWNLTCPPCLHKIPSLDSLVSKFGTDKMNYLAISKESDVDLKTYTPKMNWRFEHLADGEAVMHEQFEYRWTLPMIWIVGPDLTLRYVGSSIQEAEKIILFLRE